MEESNYLPFGPQGGTSSGHTASISSCAVRRLRGGPAHRGTSKAGVKLKFSGQPFQVLAILLEHPGDVVTREELQSRLWPDTFVDAERNLNTAINKIRDVLGDSAESPRYVETLPRRGYRFVAPLEGDFPASGQFVEKPPDPKSRVGGRSVYYRLTLLGAMIVAVGLLALWRIVSRTPGAPKVVRFIQLTNDGRAKSGPLATDGLRIYFNELLPNGRNFVAQVSVRGGETIPLSIPLNQPGLLDLSKDRTEFLLADFVGDNNGNSLWVQPVAGGSPRRAGTLVARNARFGGTIFAANAAFEPDGTTIIYADGREVYSASKDGSSPRKLLTTEEIPFVFRFSPDAKVFRFTQFDLSLNTMNIMEARADGTGLRKVFAGCCGEWSPGARFYIFQNGVAGKLNLWASPDEGSRARRNQEVKPTQLTAGPLDFEDPLPSKDGKEIFAIGSSRQAEVIRYDSHSGAFVPFLNGISAEGLAFSQDGKWVAYISYPDGTLWRCKADGSERLQLTFSPMRASMPRWSPNGKQIAFNASVGEAPWNIYIVSSAGGISQHLLPSDQGQLDVDWSPDGNSLVFGSAFIQGAPISIIDLRSRRVSILQGSYGFFSPHWSPDGRYMAAMTTERSKLNAL